STPTPDQSLSTFDPYSPSLAFPAELKAHLPGRETISRQPQAGKQRKSDHVAGSGAAPGSAFSVGVDGDGVKLRDFEVRSHAVEVEIGTAPPRDRHRSRVLERDQVDETGPELLRLIHAVVNRVAEEMVRRAGPDADELLQFLGTGDRRVATKVERLDEQELARRGHLVVLAEVVRGLQPAELRRLLGVDDPDGVGVGHGRERKTRARIPL